MSHLNPLAAAVIYAHRLRAVLLAAALAGPAVNTGPHGPRASILRVGVCELLDNDVWFIQGWLFNHRNDASLLFPCPYVHDDEHRHVGYLGWTFAELRSLSETEFELAGIETVPNQGDS